MSIGCLTGDELKTSFNASTCEIHHGSKTIMKGLQHGKDLYLLTDPASVEHIKMAQAIPMLDTGTDISAMSITLQS